MLINCILFDMDGVLIDSELAIRTCCIEALHDYGVNAVHEDFFEFTGMGEDSFIGGVSRKYGKAYVPEMKALAYKYYCRRATELVVVYDGIKDMLITLKSKGYKLAVASSADRIKVETNLKCMKIDAELFDAVITGSEITNKKPDPEIYLTASKRVSGLPENCVVIEDALSGISAAKSAGMLCICVTSAFDAQTLKNKGADYVVEHTPDIVELLEKINQNKI
jgi:HAD superfamily hydrolase (TIGR01509 family)